ncbi:nuclear transport factor 2 family protein [Polyangium jinanense]|uniref:Nuclear transport factor 2 family protein n=1 Tax=Polyangium jinanense TaxID=2829994 RepID=A0A9X4AQW9_9BACT|nr:nuclear transport factor 2 family protein [Polyangium jinanense]MDC3953417.1 nuclear transport factor 2 family protein [Polyangium jinanense]MDC3979462.1 nuclear transport factor 2 family protein [Polyangium jinanense]
MEWSRDDVLAVVKSSPDRVAAHDKAGWVGLFAHGAVVEDPVGGPPARKGADPRDGDDELGRFYDVYIAPNDVHFEVLADVVQGLVVVRDVNITTRTPNDARVALPAYLIYELGEFDGALRVTRMRAFWELRGVTAAALKGGPKSLIAMTGLTARMLRIQGFSNVSTYLEGLWRGIFERGHATVEELARTIGERDLAGLRGLFTDDEPRIEIDPGKRYTPRSLFDALGPGASLEVEAPISAGFFTGFRCTLMAHGARRSGIGLLEFDPHTRSCTSARLYLE